MSWHVKVPFFYETIDLLYLLLKVGSETGLHPLVELINCA